MTLDRDDYNSLTAVSYPVTVGSFMIGVLATEIKEELKQSLKRSFKDSFELGGGKEYRYFHGVQAAEFSERIARSENLAVDFDALFVASLFHDIGKIKAVTGDGFIDYNSEANRNHENIEFAALNRVIGDTIQDETLLRKAAEIIRSTKSEKLSLEAKILKDADELGNFGFLQVWRTITYAALGKLNFEENLNYWKKEGRKSREELLKNLYFETSKKVAAARLRKLEHFMVEIEKESRGDDFDREL